MKLISFENNVHCILFFVETKCVFFTKNITKLQNNIRVLQKHNIDLKTYFHFAYKCDCDR